MTAFHSVLFFLLSSFFSATAEQFLTPASPAPLERCASIIASLTEDKTLFSSTVEQLKDLKANRGNQKVIVNTSQFFPEKLMQEIHASLPSGANIKLELDSKTDLGKSHYEKDNLSDKQKEPFRKYLKFVVESVNTALGPEEQLEVQIAEIRVVKKENAIKNNLLRSDQFYVNHTDYMSYITATVDLVGEGTYYTENPTAGPIIRDPKITPRGQTIFFSGEERKRQIPQVQPLWHSSPTKAQDRLVLFIQFQRKAKSP